MRAKLSFDVESKSYVWTIVHENHPAVIEVETINGVINIANCPTRSGLYTSILGERLASKDNPWTFAFMENFTDQKTYPLFSFMFTEIPTTKKDPSDNFKFWNPIQKEFMSCHGTGQFIPIAIAIHTDILNHVLSQPKQIDQMRATYLHDRAAVESFDPLAKPEPEPVSKDVTVVASK